MPDNPHSICFEVFKKWLMNTQNAQKPTAS